MIDLNAGEYLKSLNIQNESIKKGVERFFKEARILDGRLVHERLNLYVDMGKACTADCAFCIAKVRDKSHRIKNFQSQLEGLKRAVKICHSVEILGGEPLLFAGEIRKMLPYIKSTEKCVFVTNATRHLYLKNLDILQEFDHIDISRHALDDAENKKVLRTQVDLLTKDDIGSLPPGMKSKIRFNITCFRGGIDDPDKMISYVKEFVDRGITQFMFANLTKLPKGFYESEVEEFTDKYRLPNRTFNDAEKRFLDLGYRKTKSIDGLGYKVRIFEKDGTKIILKENDDSQNQKLLRDMYQKLGLIADLVLTPNGEAYTDWYYSNRLF